MIFDRVSQESFRVSQESFILYTSLLYLIQNYST